MSVLDRMERRFGRFAIPNLMKYIIIGTIIAYVLSLINPQYLNYLYLSPSLVLKGQVWRLITFIFIPSNTQNILFFALSMYFNYFLGSMLEARWGAFRFNVFYFTGVLATIVASFLFQSYGTPDYLNETLFLAFATLYPDLRVLLFFFIPIKVKWMGWFMAAMLVVQFIIGSWSARGFIIVSLLNYILFFGPKLLGRIRDMRRRETYIHAATWHGSSKSTSGGKSASKGKSHPKGKIIDDVPFHRCYVCGKTEKDDPNMQFRYCSECNGNYEYCMDHLYNHKHIQ